MAEKDINIYQHKAVCLQRGYDVAKLKIELDKVLRDSEWFERINGVWHAIPLRSYQGGITPLHISHMGNSLYAPASDFKDTKWLEMCPYLADICHALGPDVFKIRFMQMSANKILHTHTDNFPHKNVVRIHLAIRSHPNVTMTVEDKTWHIGEGELWFANVKRPHSVKNQSDIDRVHVVIDVAWSEKLEELYQQALTHADDVIC